MILATTLSWALSSAPPAAAAPPCLSTIQELYRANNYTGAAVAADRCWATTGERDALFLAALSYQHLNECARVLVLTGRLLALQDIPANARDKIKELADECRQQSVEVHIRYTPSETGIEAILHAGRLSSINEDLVIVLSQAEGEPGDRRVYLDPGKWQLRLERDDDLQAQGVEITDAPGTTEVSFADPPPAALPPEDEEPPPPPPPLTDERPRRKISLETTLGLATLAPSVTLLAGGAALTSIGVDEYRDGLRGVDKYRDGPRSVEELEELKASGRTAFRGVWWSTQGMAMLGTSLGAGAVAITDFAGANERALLVETAAGGAVALGGLAWWVTETQSYKTEVEHLESRHFSEVYPRDLAASAIFGLGTGMAISAAASLLVTKLRRRMGRSGQVARRRER